MPEIGHAQSFRPKLQSTPSNLKAGISEWSKGPQWGGRGGLPWGAVASLGQGRSSPLLSSLMMTGESSKGKSKPHLVLDSLWHDKFSNLHQSPISRASTTLLCREIVSALNTPPNMIWQLFEVFCLSSKQGVKVFDIWSSCDLWHCVLACVGGGARKREIPTNFIST